MKRLLGTTAMAVVIATSALAQSTTQPKATDQTSATSQMGAGSMAWVSRSETGDRLASDVIGATLYAADANGTTAEARDSWESIGEINDLLLTSDGRIRAVLVDVGTFLGMGGKTVAAPMSALRYVTDGSDVDDFFVVVTVDRETLQGAPAYERPSERLEENTMNTPMNDTAMRNSATSSPFAYKGYDRAENHALTVDALENATVYGRGDEKIGSISELVVTKEGKITDAVIDVGGFLGMGARSVSMPFADLTVLRKSGGDDVRVYLDATKEKLEAMPRYEG